MQQLTEGHDTGVCLGRRQECGDPGWWEGEGGRGGRQSDARTTNQPCALFALTQASELIAATSRKGGALLSRGQGSCQVIRSLGW